MPAAAHFVTFRVADTIPLSMLRKWRAERTHSIHNRSLSAVNAHKRFFAVYDRFLDRLTNVTWLAKAEIASMIRTALYYHHESKYRLLSYSIMPNHVHLLILPMERPCPRPPDYLPDERADRDSPLSAMMHSIKSYTALQANRILNRSGQFWQHESYDHWVRDDEELKRIAAYIDNNALVGGLSPNPHEYRWCSARDNFECFGWKHGLMLEL